MISKVISRVGRCDVDARHRHQSFASGREILVVIPTLNEERKIEECLQSLYSGSVRMESASVFVADGGSEDGTLEILTKLCEQYPNLHIIKNEQRLQSAAVNLVCFDHATEDHKYLVRCDAHSIYPPDFVGQVADGLAGDQIASLVVSMDAKGDSGFGEALAWVVDTRLGSGGAPHRGKSISREVSHGHHAGFNIRWFREIGGYDETFSHNEDAEFDLRLTKAGGVIWLESSLAITYIVRGTPFLLAKQYYSYGFGRAKTLRKHSKMPQPRQLIPVVNFLLLVSSFLGSFINPFFLVWPLTYFAILIAVSVCCSVSLKKLHGASAGVALAIIHNCWAIGFLKGMFRRNQS